MFKEFDYMHTCYAFDSALLCYCHYLKFGDFPYFLSDLVNVFEVFLPQLLLYPNASDPLNSDAAALMIRDHATYEQRVKGGNPFYKNYNIFFMFR